MIIIIILYTPLEAAPTGVRKSIFTGNAVASSLSVDIVCKQENLDFYSLWIYKFQTNHKVRESPFFSCGISLFFCVYWGKFVFLSPMFSPVRSRHLTAPEKRLPFHLPST